jgi:pimeloyl-ACP methyl ester carboxylesterase
MTTGTASRIRFAMRKHSRLAYRGAGGENDAPVVLLHDLLFTQSVFASIQMPGLFPDARGHGASATLANQWISMAELADDLAAVLDAEAMPSAHIGGHGLGGAIAFAFAQRHPKRVRSLLLIEPALPSLLDNDLDRGARELRDERRATDRAAGDAAYKGLTDAALDGVLTPRMGPEWRARATKARMAAIRRNAGALAGMLPALDAFTPTRSDARLVAAPTTLLAGPDAAPVEQLVIARLAQAMPDAEVRPWAFADRLNDPFGGNSATLIEAILRDVINR